VEKETHRYNRKRGLTSGFGENSLILRTVEQILSNDNVALKVHHHALHIKKFQIYDLLKNIKVISN